MIYTVQEMSSRVNNLSKNSVENLLEIGNIFNESKSNFTTNDYKEFKSALTTQGIGLVYRESFNSLAELWDSWKSSTADSKKERDAKKKEREEKAALKQEEQEKGK